MFSYCCWTLPLPTTSWQWTNLSPLTSNELVLDYTKGCRDWQSHSAMERATERTSATRMHICEVCNKLFTRKDNLSQHLSVHGEKRFQCNHCSKCYSRGKKPQVYIFRHHTNEKQKFSDKSLIVDIAPRCLGGHSTLDVTLLCARKNPLKLPRLIWKPW